MISQRLLILYSNRKLAEVFAVQEEIAREISEKLRLKLTGKPRTILNVLAGIRLLRESSHPPCTGEMGAPQASLRFLYRREAQAVTSLSHPHVSQIRCGPAVDSGALDQLISIARAETLVQSSLVPHSVLLRQI